VWSAFSEAHQVDHQQLHKPHVKRQSFCAVVYTAVVWSAFSEAHQVDHQQLHKPHVKRQSFVQLFKLQLCGLLLVKLIK